MSSLKDKKTGRTYWRSLEQMTDTPEFKEILHREFPAHASELDNSWTRRNFLTLMGASFALAGLAACRRPEYKAVSYVKQPEEVIPGMPLNFATTMPLGLSAMGVVVESHEGRPTKIEGNTLHPSSLGAATIFGYGSTLDLYDPDRSRTATFKGTEKKFEDFVAAWREQYTQFLANKGQGLAVLTESFASPTQMRLVNEFKKTFPNASVVAHESVSDRNIYDGIALATGKTAFPSYDFSKAKIILALDSDFGQTESESIRNSRGFADGRRVSSPSDDMNRLYVVESTFSTTGGMADHRLRLQAHKIGDFALALASRLGLSVGSGATDFDAKFLDVLAKDLAANKGASLVVAGYRQPAWVHAVVAAINHTLGNTGTTVQYHEPVDTMLPDSGAFAELTARMKSGSVTALVILGGNPVYTASADVDFATALKAVPFSAHVSSHIDETSQLTTWHLPHAHYLESWGDARSTDGTLSIIQPLIAPMYDGRTAGEVLQLLFTAAEKKGYELVRETWTPVLGQTGFEAKWRRVVHDGLMTGSATQPSGISINTMAIANAAQSHVSLASGEIEVTYHVSPAVYDGRFANNGWLQEAPDVVTKVTWDNVVVISRATAERIGVKNEDVVKLTLDGRSVEGPIWITPGQADNSIALTVGYGRTAAGQVGNGVGFDVHKIRSSAHPYMDAGISIAPTGGTYLIAVTQNHGSMEGRPIIREATLEEFRKDPKFAPEMVEHPPLRAMWNEHKYDTGYQWGMSIDLNVCLGCNACAIACQSENNIPVVGKEQVRRGREMAWIRIDRYFGGTNVDEPEMVVQPMACQHCEMAPCEQVCPVAATNHDKEGLNVMVYNRCIGTRYCSNNCPYKVRRFNFFNYTKDYHETIKMAQNPDVTVRSRGVMEKCTYCVQRINEVKLLAKRENRTVKDGEVMTACQQSCPTQAIVFGNILDPESAVSKMKKQDRNYDLLAELYTKPRTSFLAKLRNPNPELETPKVENTAHHG